MKKIKNTTKFIKNQNIFNKTLKMNNIKIYYKRN